MRKNIIIAHKVGVDGNPIINTVKIFDKKAEAIKNKMKNEVIDAINLKEKPDDVSISTMTVTCELQTELNVENIARYISLSPIGIIDIRYGLKDNIYTNRSLYSKKRITKKKKQKKVFFNQVSLYVNVASKKENPVNVKLFINGSVQMTGCIVIDHAIDALEKILSELQNVKAIVDYKTKKMIDQPFAKDLSVLKMDKVLKFRVDMINSNFVVPFKIDRPKLYNVLESDGYVCEYDPERHACVNLKYTHPEKDITILIFEGGSIIITGVKTCPQIKYGYEFINKYLLSHLQEIVKNDVLTNANIMKYLSDI